MPVAIEVVPAQVAQLKHYGESRTLAIGRAVDALAPLEAGDAAAPSAVHLPTADEVRAQGYIAAWALSRSAADRLEVAPDRFLRSLSRTGDTVRVAVPPALLDALGFATDRAAWESGPAWCGRCGYRADSEHGVHTHTGLAHDGDPYVLDEEPDVEDLVGEGPIPDADAGTPVAADAATATAADAGTAAGSDTDADADADAVVVAGADADAGPTFVVSVGVEDPVVVFEPARSRTVVAPDPVAGGPGSAVATDGGAVVPHF